LTVGQVRAWARAHRRRTRHWPGRSSGPIPEAPGETWSAIHAALADGYRGLPGGLTLRGLLRGGRPRKAPGRPGPTVARTLASAGARRRRTGSWPDARSGPVTGVPGETWRHIDDALRLGLQGLRGGRTVTRLLAERRGRRTRCYPSPLAEAEIL